MIKAYVDKKNRPQQKMVEKPKDGTVDIGGLWNSPADGGRTDNLQGARFVVDLPKKKLVLATAAPGMH